MYFRYACFATEKVFFELMLFLYRRGKENLRTLKNSFVVKIDGNGVEFIEKSMDELTKITERATRMRRVELSTQMVNLIAQLFRISCTFLA